MQIHLSEKTIAKPAGKRTAASIITFLDLTECIEIFGKEIDTESASHSFKEWKESGYDESLLYGMLHDIIVKFGEGHRIWGRFSSYYSENLNLVSQSLQKAIQSNDVSEALACVRGIKGLGESYASKVLRFIDPKFVVLDSILRDELCGNMPYEEFRRGCEAISVELDCSPVEVESALFTYVQLANPKTKKRWRKYQ